MVNCKMNHPTKSSNFRRSRFGEAATSRLHRERHSEGVPKLRTDAKDGGNVSGVARRSFEDQLGKSIITDENYLKEPEKSKRRKHLNQ